MIKVEVYYGRSDRTWAVLPIAVDDRPCRDEYQIGQQAIIKAREVLAHAEIEAAFVGVYAITYPESL